MKLSNVTRAKLLKHNIKVLKQSYTKAVYSRFVKNNRISLKLS